MSRIIMQTASCLVGIILLFGGNAFAAGCPDLGVSPLNGCSLPGIRDGGFPFFETGVTVDYKDTKKGFKIKPHTGPKDSKLWINATDSLTIEKTKFKSSKIKVKDGVASAGKRLKIEGIIPDLGIKGTLVKFDLQGDWAVSIDGTLLGFDTMNIECHEALDALLDCTDAESLYFALSETINGAKKLKKVPAIAVTTVPLPAAVWLFGSGLLGLVGVARTRRHTT